MDDMMKAYSRREKKALAALGLKRCTTCGKIKAFAKYAKNSSAPDGKMPRCKVCTSLYMKARYETQKATAEEKGTVHKQPRGSLEARKAARVKRNARIARVSDGTITKTAVKEMLAFCNHTCMWPGCTETKDLTIDHVIPLLKKTGKKGTHSIKNIQILCRHHNSQKGHVAVVDLRPPEWPWR